MSDQPQNPAQPITQRFPRQKQTVLIDGDFKRKLINKPEHIQETDYTPANKRLALFILGMVERVDFDLVPSVILGRYEKNAKANHELDLSDYGAADRGVSRVHCQLEMQDGTIIVTDLGSTNGTFVGGQRLEPNQPYPLNRGDELIVGRLPIQVVSSR